MNLRRWIACFNAFSIGNQLDSTYVYEWAVALALWAQAGLRARKENVCGKWRWFSG